MIKAASWFQPENDDRVLTGDLVSRIVVAGGNGDELLSVDLVGDQSPVESASVQTVPKQECTGFGVEHHEIPIDLTGNDDITGRRNQSSKRRRGQPVTPHQPPVPRFECVDQAECLLDRVELGVTRRSRPTKIGLARLVSRRGSLDRRATPVDAVHVVEAAIRGERGTVPLSSRDGANRRYEVVGIEVVPFSYRETIGA